MGRHRRSAAGRAEPAAASPAGTPTGPGHDAYDHDAYDYDRDAAYGDHATYGGRTAYRDHAAHGAYVSAPYATPAPYEPPTPSSTPGPYATPATYTASPPRDPYATPETGPGLSADSRDTHYAPDALGDDHGGASGHRRKRRGAPVRTGLLGVSAAVALGAVAVSTGLLPGGDYSFGGGHDAKVRAADAPSGEGQGDEASAADRTTPAASRGATRSDAPSRAASASPREKKSKAATPSPSRSVTTKQGGTGTG
ncbi:CAP domain-containing protein, partial [Streptomyces sp. NEAU-H3]|nr:CAP domain-containing protein [Streptomyces sp. NEAU-H3]